VLVIKRSMFLKIFLSCYVSLDTPPFIPSFRLTIYCYIICIRAATIGARIRTLVHLNFNDEKAKVPQLHTYLLFSVIVFLEPLLAKK